MLPGMLDVNREPVAGSGPKPGCRCGSRKWPAELANPGFATAIGMLLYGSPHPRNPRRREQRFAFQLRAIFAGPVLTDAESGDCDP